MGIKPKVICMIPARMGSQRLKKKNLQLLKGLPIIKVAIKKAKKITLFDEIWINSEHKIFHDIAIDEKVFFHKRPNELANNQATSEDFIYEFLKKNKCDILIQLHTIAPLLKKESIESFTKILITENYDSQFSVVNEQIECCYQGNPINFDFKIKTNSQEIKPVQRITWSISGWKSKSFINAYDDGFCATYYGNKNFFQISREEGLIIKTKEDLHTIEKYVS